MKARLPQQEFRMLLLRGRRHILGVFLSTGVLFFILLAMAHLLKVKTQDSSDFLGHFVQQLSFWF